VARTITPVGVNVGGQEAEVLFSGLTPGFIGLYQVNAIVPTQAPVGGEVPLTISVGNRISSEVAVAIQ
jgi:uncharacterized protein (TIGR03437 family)